MKFRGLNPVLTKFGWVKVVLTKVLWVQLLLTKFRRLKPALLKAALLERCSTHQFATAFRNWMCATFLAWS